MKNLNLKKFFLYLLISSVAISALLGIGVILFGDFGKFEVRVLMTTLTVTVTSVLGLAGGACLETKRGRILPGCGIIFAVLSAILWIVFIWNDFSDEELLIKIGFSITILAFSCSHISLLSIARLDRRFLWSRYGAHLSVWTLTAILLGITWANSRETNEFILRAISVLSIIIAALTIVTPIFHRLSQQLPKAEEIDAEIARLRARIEELEKQKAELSI
jgi:hypothetical protein